MTLAICLTLSSYMWRVVQCAHFEPKSEVALFILYLPSLYILHLHEENIATASLSRMSRENQAQSDLQFEAEPPN